MWRFKQFMPKEQTGLEGRTIDIGNLKVIVRHAIAEGGFSFVYLARDAIHGTKQYALKHIICNDEESLQLVKKEISVMKSLKGHPSLVTLHAHAFFDMGRTKEAFLAMEYCEKSLVGLLESRGAAYFEEKQILLMFRDVCNAIFAMHCQSPPIAHRDLKAENILLGSDGSWKLCDFGSTSTNHKRFERPEEMGIEEDNIRKYTTPAYRAPEMWDLYRREVINEKVDIWALGCLLFRISYFKSAFDGESKLQILNGNYRIPDLPKYSSSITDLIKDMLQASPDARPDITQVWFRVNDLLPVELQKSLPDRPPEMTNQGEIIRPRFDSEPSNHNTAKPGGSLGAFWSTDHAKESPVVGDTTRSRVDGEPGSHSTARHDRHGPSHRRTQSKDETIQPPKNVHGKSTSRSQDGFPKDFEINFPDGPVKVIVERPRASKSESTSTFQNDAFDTFVAEFDTNKFSNNSKKSQKEMELEGEIERLREELKQVNVDKAGVTSKCEKLAAICRSQREEIHELKQALSSARTPPNREVPKGKLSSAAAQPAVTKQTQQMDNKTGTVWELQEDLFSSPSPSPEPRQWQAFAEQPKKETTAAAAANRSPNSGGNSWGFETDSFTAIPTTTSPQIYRPINEANSFQRVGVSKKVENKSTSQPSGWAGF